MARTIEAPVGSGGKNRRDDVIAVQELLNAVPPEKGGPQPKLKVDGLSGPKTCGAIKTFQLRQVGREFTDGRVDPGGPTLVRLNELAEAENRGLQDVLRLLHAVEKLAAEQGPIDPFALTDYGPGKSPLGGKLQELERAMIALSRKSRS